MRAFGFFWRFAFLLALLVTGCGPTPSGFTLTPTWADGELSRYDVLDRSGTVQGSAEWSWHKDGEGWRLEHSLDMAARHEKATVHLDARLAPLSALHEQPKKRLETRYQPKSISITEGGKTKTVAASNSDVDNDASLAVLRGLPLAVGWVTEYHDIVPASASSVPIRVSVDRLEDVKVPAGTFHCFHVLLQSGAVAHEVWYDQSAPHWMVRYKNTGSGSVFELRTYRLSSEGPLQGNASPATVVPHAPARPRVAQILAVVLVQLPLMLLLPIFVGRLIYKRTGAGVGLWLIGALTFIASQVVHIPLNIATGLLGAARGLGLLPLPALALVAGLSAGLCEELARYVTAKILLKRRTLAFAEALQLGAGHGGIEAMILGVLSAIAFLFMLALYLLPGPMARLIPEPDALRTAQDTYWSLPLTASIVGGLERVSAMAAHLGMNVLVVRAAVNRNIAWLVAAIAAHAIVDGYAVWASRMLGTAWTEIGVAVFAALILAIAFGVRGFSREAVNP